jgi:hypothetical protein
LYRMRPALLPCCNSILEKYRDKMGIGQYKKVRQTFFNESSMRHRIISYNLQRKSHKE